VRDNGRQEPFSVAACPGVDGAEDSGRPISGLPQRSVGPSSAMSGDITVKQGATTSATILTCLVVQGVIGLG
jgi:hypothetical protein